MPDASNKAPWWAIPGTVIVVALIGAGTFIYTSGNVPAPVTPDNPVPAPLSSLRDSLPAPVAEKWGYCYLALARSLREDKPNPTAPERGKVYRTVGDFDTAHERLLTLAKHAYKLPSTPQSVDDEISRRYAAATGGLQNPGASIDEMGRRDNLIRVSEELAYELAPSLKSS